MSDEDKRRSAERLRVYWLALDFLNVVDELLTRVPVKGSLGEQLRRSAESILLNIREGAAHVTPGKKSYHYQLAHGSGNECIGALHGFTSRYRTLKFTREIRMANMICMMLLGLIKAQEKREDD